MSDFRSDTVTRPTAAMKQAMFDAEVGDDVFGDDPTVNRLEALAADLLGFEAALFAPSGTQTNQIALQTHCQRGDEVIVGQQWHLYRWEAGGMAVLGSLQPQPLPNQPDGTIALKDIEAEIKPDDPHFARTRLITIENTTGGKLLPLAYLESVRALADRRGLLTHLDGARLFNAAVAQAQLDGSTARQAARAICRPFHSVSVCLSKGLGAPVGSLLLGSAAFIRQGRRVRKMLGGGMRQAGFLAAAGIHALEHHVDRLAEDHANAALLSAELARAVAANPALAGKVTVPAAHTNMLFVDAEPEAGEALLAYLQAQGIKLTGRTAGGNCRMRFVTHLDVTQDDVLQVARAVSRFPG